MHTFDYSRTPNSLKTDEIVNMLLTIREYKGRQIALNSVKPDVLNSLLKQAKYASAQASNRIEGIVTTEARLEQLMLESTAPRNRNEEEIAGYRDVLALIHEQHNYIDIKPSVILQLHRNLMSHTGYAFGGSWKDSDNQIVTRESDGTTHVRFRPTPALLTPTAVEQLCDTYRNAISAGIVDPLLLSIRFVFDFVSIHPFNDGNGRMSRLLTVLLLERCGHLAPRYISIEKQIEQSKELYYETLAASSMGWETAKNDEAPFVRYMLGIILASYRELFDRIDGSCALTKAERVARVFDQKLGRITKADIKSSCPDISLTTIERTLKELLDAGTIVRVGSGRSSAYVKRS